MEQAVIVEYGYCFCKTAEQIPEKWLGDCHPAGL